MLPSKNSPWQFFAGLLLRRLGVYFVQRYDVSSSLTDTQSLTALARGGRTLVVFPEGTYLCKLIPPCRAQVIENKYIELGVDRSDFLGLPEVPPRLVIAVANDLAPPFPLLKLGNKGLAADHMKKISGLLAAISARLGIWIASKAGGRLRQNPLTKPDPSDAESLDAEDRAALSRLRVSSAFRREGT